MKKSKTGKGAWKTASLLKMNNICYCGYKVDDEELDNLTDMHGEPICRYCNEVENERREKTKV